MSWEKELDVLYSDAELYESEYATILDDIEFWKDFIKSRHVEDLLELGCGSGRIGIHLVDNLKEYVGIDISDDFIDKFQTKIKDKKMECKVSIFKSNMMDFCLDKKFDMIILPFNTISHIYTGEQFKNLITCVKKHLKNDGEFVIDCFNPDFRFLCDNSEPKKINEFVHEKLQDTFYVYETNRYDKAMQINRIMRIYKNINTGKEVCLPLPMKIYFPMEIESALFYMGMNIAEKYGDYDLSDYANDSRKQIIVSKCEATNYNQ